MQRGRTDIRAPGVAKKSQLVFPVSIGELDRISVMINQIIWPY